MKKSELNQYRKALLGKKAELEKSVRAGLLPDGQSTDGHGDFADRRSGAIEDELTSHN